MKNQVGVLALAVSLATWTVAFGQQERSEEKAGDKPESEQQVSKIAGDLRSANELMGMSVENRDGKELGEIENIILDRDQNRVTYVVVAAGGILDVGDTLFVVPWEKFSFDDKEKILLDLPEAKLKTAPSIDSVSSIRFESPQFVEDIYTYYNATPYPLRDRSQMRTRGSQTVTRQQQSQAQQRQRAQAQSPARSDEFDWAAWSNRPGFAHWATPVDKVIGTTVHDPEGDEVGDIKDVIFDTREGRATYALISVGGIFGFFADTAAIPWMALDLDEDQEHYALDTTKEALEMAKLESDGYEQLENDQFSRELHAAFNTEPYWVVHGYVSPSSSEQQRTRAIPRAESRRPAIDRQDPVVVTGQVQSIQSHSPGAAQRQELEGVVEVRLLSTDGKEHLVQLVPQARLKQMDITLSEGDEITVRGIEKESRVQKVFQATEITIDGKTHLLRAPGAGEAQQRRQGESPQPPNN